MCKKKMLGCNPSIIDGSEHIFSAPSISLPEEFCYSEVLPKVLNQGELSICVPCSISAYLNWNKNLKDGSKKDNDIELMDIYNCRTNEGEGMTFKEALKFIRHEGVNSKEGNLKIKSYSMVRNFMDLKMALILNGPCLGALPVYSYDSDFWNKEKGGLKGYHAISIVGYDEEGFIIRNSWGRSFGKNGYTKLPYEDFGKFIEVWTVVS